jgi:hypothetical protein
MTTLEKLQAEGKAEGKAELLLKLLTLRFGVLPELHRTPRIRRGRGAEASPRSPAGGAVPRVLEELRSGAIHLSGLFLLSQHLTPENADTLLDEAVGLV